MLAQREPGCTAGHQSPRSTQKPRDNKPYLLLTGRIYRIRIVIEIVKQIVGVRCVGNRRSYGLAATDDPRFVFRVERPEKIVCRGSRVSRR
jgi:hypothetical protein